ncbi:MAG: transglycosylase domain-containing protein [Lachnospiraceae bacterium]|nr:transglycosylase domain-containing protein [Lachnospiraceae bacterium]
MDFSRDGINRKRKELKSVSRRMNSKLLLNVFRFSVIAIIILIILGIVAGFGAFKGILDTTPAIEIVELEVKGYSSKSLLADGTVAQTFAGASANRIRVGIDKIPEMARNACIAIEDERFYKHSGIDIRTIFRSGFSLVNSGFQAGGSTLTQQLIKNQIFGGGREKYFMDTVLRKIQEQYIAINLEHVLSKDEILEYYLNLVNFGNGAYGIETAALSYFGKSVSELTLSEIAVIAGIPLSPTRLNPLTNPSENVGRRQSVLDNMLRLNMITQEEYDEAMADTDDVYIRIAENSSRDNKAQVKTYSYFTDAMIEQIYDDLQERLGYTRSEAEHLLYYGGITIYTTQDPEIQAIVDKYYQDENNFPKFGFDSSHGSCYELSEYKLSVLHSDETETHYQKSDFLKFFSDYDDKKGYYYHEDGVKKGISDLFLNMDDLEEKIDEFKAAKVDTEAGDKISGERKEINPQPQSSMTIIEQSTGKVVAIYGGRGEKTVSRSLNRAYGTTRAVGSTFKVLASFLPALDAGGLTLASVQDDSPFFYPNGGKEVINWYSTGFRGLQSIRTGICNSLNIVAVKTLEQIGAPLGFEYLQKLGFSTLVEYRVDENGRSYTDKNLTIALGGLTDGVTNTELTAAYATIANGGLYNRPIFYTKILDHEGNVILSNNTEPNQVMKTSTAWLLTDAMHDTTTKGTGTRLAFRNYKMPVAGKTGTASKNSDLWFVGYTPYYTCAVWTGFDHPLNQWNKTYQQDLWRNIMEEIHVTKELEYKEWEKPDSIVEADICTKCGNLAVYGLCDNAADGSCIKREYFAKGTVPTKKCTCHVRVTLCSESGRIAGPYCPDGCKRSAVLLMKSEDYTKYNGYPGYTNGCYVSTWDTPYIYHPERECDVHNEFSEAEGDGEEGGEGDLFGEAPHVGIEDDVYE